MAALAGDRTDADDAGAGNSIYVLARWGLIMQVIRAIPEAVFKRLSL